MRSLDSRKRNAGFIEIGFARWMDLITFRYSPKMVYRATIGLLSKITLLGSIICGSLCGISSYRTFFSLSHRLEILNFAVTTVEASGNE